MAREIDRTLERAIGSQDELHGLAAMSAALRGDLETARGHAALPTLRDSEDPQNLSLARLADMLIAMADDRPRDALEAGREAFELISQVGLGSVLTIWCWAGAVRAAFEVDDEPAVQDLIAVLEEHPRGHLPPVLRAELVLARARLVARAGDPDAEAQFLDAIARHRDLGTQYYLAHALLDLATFRAASGSDPAELTAEAEVIAAALPCPPLLRRVAALRTAPIGGR
jgi:hypothetical protein